MGLGFGDRLGVGRGGVDVGLGERDGAGVPAGGAVTTTIRVAPPTDAAGAPGDPLAPRGPAGPAGPADGTGRLSMRRPLRTVRASATATSKPTVASTTSAATL